MFSERIAVVQDRIVAAARRAGRSDNEITLVAVSKGQSIEAIEQAWAAGQRDFGENYAQEWQEKALALKAKGIMPNWHFVGRLQRNKVRALVGQVSLIHSVDSIQLVGEIDKRTEAPQDVLLQLNLAGEAQKGGALPSQLGGLLEAARHSKHVRVVGLMTVPPLDIDPEKARSLYASLRELACQHGLRELSMGMSSDFEVAIEERATLVRIGTFIFGQRNK